MSKRLPQFMFGAALALAFIKVIAPASAQTPALLNACFGRDNLPPAAQIDACSAVIQTGRERQPVMSQVYNTRGNLFRERNEFDRAIADFDQAIQLDAKNIAAHTNRGLANRDKGDIEAALHDFEIVLRADPKNFNLFNLRSQIYFGRQDYDAAISDLNQAIKANPQFAPSLFNRAVAYRAKGDKERAMADFDQAVKLNPREDSR